jgi:peptidoglycan/LPS O-acetylase OafA/YrhL
MATAASTATPSLPASVGHARDDDGRVSATSSALSRNAGIDLLRGVSILLVVLHHVGLRIPLQRTALAEVVPVRVLKALIYNGYESVMMFFVVSGFLIATNVVRRWGSLGSIQPRAFYLRRGARIIPCLGLLVAVLSLLHLAGVRDYVISRAGQSLPRAIASAALLHLNWYEGHTGYLPGGWDVLWSLSIEEAFYLAFPVLCWLLRRDWMLAPPLALLALSLPLARAALRANEVWQEKAYLPGMGAIAAGVLGAILVARVPRPARWARFGIGGLGVAGIVLVLFIEDILWPVLGEGTVLLLTTAATFTVVACYWRGDDDQPAVRWGLGWVRSFGRLSYEIYLTHMFVVFAVLRLWRAWGENLPYGFAWYAVVAPGSWALGWAVSRFISVPCERAVMSWGLARPA